MDLLVGGYWAAAAVAIMISSLLTWQTWEHRRFVRSRGRRPNRIPLRPHVALFVPCKGADKDLEANLRPLFEQDRENYQLVFTVESAEDAACPVIRRLMGQYPGLRSRLVVAGRATESGQKVHNLLAASEHLADEIEILAFVDVDVRPPRDWLRLLTQRVAKVGVATGYRWFVPQRLTLANCLLASIDSAVVPMMFPSRRHLVWGGSWAIRRDIFENSGLRERWRGTLSDDLVASRVLTELRQRVAVESSCIMPSPIDVTFGELFAFVRRQFTIGRYYARSLWRWVLVANCLSQVTFWGSLAVALDGLLRGNRWAAWAGGVAGGLYALHVARGLLRQRASRYYLPAAQYRFGAAQWFDVLLGPVVGLVCALTLASSAFGRRIVWKQIAYDMRRDGKVQQISYPAGMPAAGARSDETRRQQVA